MASSQNADDLPIILFATQVEWAAWLDEYGADARGLWVRFAKKGAALQSIDYAQAMEVALCYGWIDGKKQRHDEQSYKLRFTPRTAKSIWSAINRDKAQALMDAGKMQPAGLAAVEAAQRDGRWDAAYASSSNATVPDDLQAALDANPAAQEAFAALNRTNRYAILFRIHQAKRAETRTKRIRDYVEMLARGEKIHS